MSTKSALVKVQFETHPSRYRHLKLEVEGAVAWIKIDIQEEQGLKDGYELKLNSYDLSVDIELADAVQRLRFEHPQVTCVVVTGAQERVFSAGANIFMLASSSHAFKVNFCKYTNETRLYIEDATEHSGQTYVAALNGVASGGGYELPLACEEIYLIDDKSSAVSLPEVPFLGVLPGTGGLTRVVDKRKVRRDLADVFSTLAEGVKGKRAVKWGLVDRTWPTSKWADEVAARAAEVAGAGRPEREGIELAPITPTEDEAGLHYTHVELLWGTQPRTCRLIVKGPSAEDAQVKDPRAQGSELYALRAFRELDDALLRLRFNYPEIGLALLETVGDPQRVLDHDAALFAQRDDWFVHEVLGNMKRVLKRLDMTAKSFFALVTPESCFAGCLLELALAGDRTYMLEDDAAKLGISPLNGGLLPMGNSLSRLHSRFLKTPEVAEELASEPKLFDAQEADDAGLVTYLVDELDWEDETRLAIEERVSLSPDALTGMEASLRWAGPETLETKIFGRLTAWQNWIFQRPNAVGPKGALTLYGQPESAQFDFART
ncbi:MAG: benzoyl-CoA-dihydrodiol lyase [Planctomycetes bacterium]|nr:benzoyl-CoA-dihydrodiol lyase [Planctomycetota bacterium]